jgi:alpha-tubulin suppressor-like RCC1 family protein
MAVKSDGTVWCWGGNDSGALGDGTTDDRNVPVQVPSLTGITAVSGGGGYYYTNDYSVALGNDGTVWTWGDNTYGELGNGNTTESDVPYHVSDLSGISSVIADKGDHTLALKGDGTVWTWGNNDYGQLGNGTTTESHVPGPISSLTGIVSLSSGLDEIVALKNDGTLYGWGYNGDDSELAAGGSAATQTATPATVSNLSGITAIAAAKSHYLALKSDGTVWTWDDTTPGEISNGTTITGSSSAIQVSGLSGITQVACGTYFNMVLKSDGTVWAWGQNANGELGDGSTTDSQTPEEVYTSSGPLSGITAITCTGSFGMALKSDGTVWTWGANGSGQLGNGNTTSTDTAAEILTGITAIGAGAIDAYAIKSDGTVLAWGDNTYGQLGNGSLTLPYSPTPASVSGLTGITAVVGGYYFELALKSDGTVWTWGENQVGQLGNGTITTANDVPAQISSLTGITAISAGEDSFHSIALKNDGTLWGWGSNSNGQLGTGTYGSIGGTSPTGSDVPVQVQGLSGVTVAGLACGKYSTVALESTGAVLEWGDSSYEPIGFSVPISVTDPQVTPAPVITPAAGSYSSSQTVAISTTLGSGTIHYTLDGTAPTASSPSYTGSFTLSQSALVSAVVIYNGAAVSPMASTQFYINDTDETGLPPTPTGLTASAASVSEIDLSWTVSGMQTYSQIYVYRSTNGGSYSLIAILGPTATTFADTSITAGNSYTYKVGTSNQAGISSTSASSSVDPSGPAALTIQITTPSGATSLP